MGERKLVRALASFATVINGAPVMVAPGDLFYSDDPIVKGRDSLFGEPLVRISDGSPRQHSSVTGSAVETMTAEPGARRRLGRPAKPRIDEPGITKVRVDETVPPVETATSEV
jgi:hypothetical protein